MLRRVVQNEGAPDPKWEDPYMILEVLTPGAYKLAYLNGEYIPRSWNINQLKFYYQ